jgi:hypothetical protein
MMQPERTGGREVRWIRITAAGRHKLAARR